MNTFSAVMIAEGCFDMADIDMSEMDFDEVEELRIAAYQHLIDSGVIWQLQGSFGRAAARLIEAGLCQPAKGA